MPTKLSVSLPTKGVELPEHLWDHSFCVYGRKGIGKTTLAMSLQSLLDEEYGKGKKKALNFRFEPGRRNLANILQFPTKPGQRLTWPVFKELLEQFCEDDSFHVAVLDSLDICYDQCFAFVCEQHGVRHPKEYKENGRNASPALWDAIRMEFVTTLDALVDCGKTFVALSHEKIRIDELADGTEYERFDMTAKPAAIKVCKDLCEFVFHYGYSDATINDPESKKKERRADRVITVRNLDNSLEVSCGRSDVFLQPDGKPLYRFAVPNDAAKVAETLISAYYNDVYEYGRDLEAEKRAAAAKAKLATRRR